MKRGLGWRSASLKSEPRVLSSREQQVGESTNDEHVSNQWSKVFAARKGVITLAVTSASAADVSKATQLFPAKNLDAFYVFTKDHGVNKDPVRMHGAGATEALKPYAKAISRPRGLYTFVDTARLRNLPMMQSTLWSHSQVNIRSATQFPAPKSQQVGELIPCKIHHEPCTKRSPCRPQHSTNGAAWAA